MIRSIKRSKIIIILTIVVISILYFSGILDLVSTFFEDVYTNNIAEKYINKKIRIDYYNNHKYEFEQLAKILNKYNEIENIYKLPVIHRMNACTKYSYIINNIAICTTKNNDEVPLNDIVNYFEDINIKKIIRNNNDVIFSLISTTQYSVNFIYHQNEETIKNEIVSNENGCYIVDVIENDWYSTYRSIPLM